MWSVAFHAHGRNCSVRRVARWLLRGFPVSRKAPVGKSGKRRARHWPTRKFWRSTWLALEISAARAYRRAGYSYFLDGAVAACSVLTRCSSPLPSLRSCRGRCSRNCVPDRRLIRQKSIGRELGRAGDALAQILNKLVSRGAIALAGAMGEDGLRRRSQRDVGVLVVYREWVFAPPHAPLLFAGLAHQFVALNVSDAEPGHDVRSCSSAAPRPIRSASAPTVPRSVPVIRAVARTRRPSQTAAVIALCLHDSKYDGGSELRHVVVLDAQSPAYWKICGLTTMLAHRVITSGSSPGL